VLLDSAHIILLVQT